jgi:hypothetical protein
MLNIYVIFFSQGYIMIELVKNWILERFNERTTWNGAMLIAVGIGYLIIEPIGTILAYGSIAYGVWTIWQKEL